MNFARNDPCPCGSLKKFKTCCIGDEKNLQRLLMAKLIESLNKEKALAIELAGVMDLYRNTKQRADTLYTKMIMIGPMFTPVDMADKIAPVLCRFMQSRGPNDKWPLHSEAKIDLEDNGDVHISVPTLDGHERMKIGNVNEKPLPFEKTPVVAVARMKPGELPIINPCKNGSGNLVKEVLRNKEAIDKVLNVPDPAVDTGDNKEHAGLSATLNAYAIAKKKGFDWKGMTP